MDDELVDMFITSAPRRLPAFERGLGSGRDFKKEIDLGAPAERSALLFDLAIEIDEFFGEIEETGNIRLRKSFDPQQVPPAKDKRGFRRNGH
jgi:hypothetical protein